jgi:hypothetical protein
MPPRVGKVFEYIREDQAIKAVFRKDFFPVKKIEIRVDELIQASFSLFAKIAIEIDANHLSARDGSAQAGAKLAIAAANVKNIHGRFRNHLENIRP